MLDHCIRTEEPEIKTLYEAANWIIFAAYLIISATIAYVKYRRRDILSNWITLTFGAFIFLCGVSHFLNIVVLDYPYYGLMVFEYLMTAGASVFTAVGLVLQTPRVIKSYPSIEEYESSLEREKEARARAELDQAETARALQEKAITLAVLESHNAELEQAIAELGTLKSSIPPEAELNFDTLLSRIERMRVEVGANGK